ncbi:MAG: 2-hydroxyglutaryl-CoA dehydratase [Clostridia bacterium]|nr:2-hydroxyglutaryl-CoA dehydratase [Clostridia bacterium]
MKYFVGIDIGSISTKGVVIDENNNIVASEYIWTNASPIEASKKLINIFREKCSKEILDNIYAIGTTGSARKLIGKIIGATTIKNEITAHAVGTMSRCKDVSTIIEIGGQDSKIILIKNGVVIDYAMNTLCAAGTGAFLSSQAKRLGVEVEDIEKYYMMSKNPVKIAARCTVFAESDMIHKAQIGNKKEDLIAGLCNAVVENYTNNFVRGRNIEDKVVFQGGVSKNRGVVEAFKKKLNKEIYVDEASHLLGALGIAIIAKTEARDNKVELQLKDVEYNIRENECKGCSNGCEVLYIFEGEKLLDTIGNRCEKGGK